MDEARMKWVLDELGSSLLQVSVKPVYRANKKIPRWKVTVKGEGAEVSATYTQGQRKRAEALYDSIVDHLSWDTLLTMLPGDPLS